MKTYPLFNLFLILIPCIVLANTGQGKHTKEKTIHKEFTVATNATLQIDNSYGNLDIVTWDDNRIVMDITITTNGNDEDNVQDKLDGITVSFDADKNWVSAKTQFERNKGKSWWSWTKKNAVNMSVNYVIKMPKTNAIKLDNDYGAINLGTLEGRAEISCDYGKITTKELLADNNVLRFDYTNNCYFEYIKSGTINADYSSYTVSKAKQLTVEANYSKSKIDLIEDVSFNCDYGALTVNQSNHVRGDCNYLTLRLGDIYKTVSINSDYGSISIKELQKSTENVSIRSDFTGIKIGYDDALSFNFDLDLEYAGIKGEDGFNMQKKRIESGDKYYKGYYGNANNNCTITISSDYGGVSFSKQ